MHAKDIAIEQSDAERGKVTGTPVGCACGDGVIDGYYQRTALSESFESPAAPTTYAHNGAIPDGWISSDPMW